jgi:ABC-type multidrug transport system ATPase subunit
MSKYLIFSQGDKLIRRFEVKSNQAETVVVGSKAETAEVVIADGLISRTHAQILIDEEGMVYVIDQNSTNGTFLNDKKLTPGIPYLIDVGDSVAFVKQQVATMKVELETDGPINKKKEDFKPAGKGILEMLRLKRKLVVGRSPESDIFLDMSTVSRSHAIFKLLDGDRITLSDLDSTNGTFVNGKRISGTVTVSPSDVIVIGRSLLRLGEKPRELAKEVAIQAHGIYKRFSNGVIGLHKTDLNIPSGSMVAIMGPSGCGKSTILKCLTGESPPTKGKISLAGLELVRNYDLLKSFIGYVPQDDIIHRQLTVEQSLFYAAKLRLDDPNPVAIRAKIDKVLEQLKISEIKTSPISRISGGQRKRVSIAVELLTDPLILFLDEPTSPLDPQTIAEFMKILQDLAKSGTTVVMVTHKPEDLAFMDSVIFMAEGGHLVYNGPANAYKEYFKVETAVAVYANISGPTSKHWVQQFAGTQSRITSGDNSEQPRLQKRSNKSALSQFYWLSARYMRIKTNDLLNVAILVGQAPIIAILVYFIFDDVTLSVPFLTSLSAIWFGTSNAAREIVSEASIYKRERMFNLRIGPYILSKLAVLSLFALVQAALFSLIIYLAFQNKTPSWNDLPGTIGWVWLLTISATILGLMLSAWVNSAEKVMTLVPLVLIPQVMLAGVVTPIQSLGVEIVSYLALTRWGHEGLVLIQDKIAMQVPPSGTTSVQTGKQALTGTYDKSYQDIFGEFVYSIGLDAFMVGLLSLLLLIVLVFAMRRKDSLG